MTRVESSALSGSALRAASTDSSYRVVGGINDMPFVYCLRIGVKKTWSLYSLSSASDMIAMYDIRELVSTSSTGEVSFQDELGRLVRDEVIPGGGGAGEGEGIDGVVKLMMLLMAQRESAICQCQISSSWRPEGNRRRRLLAKVTQHHVTRRGPAFRCFNRCQNPSTCQ